MVKVLLFAENLIQKEWVLSGAPLIVGRAVPGFTPDIVIEESRVSRKQLAFTLEQGRGYVENIGGAPVLLNGSPLTGKQGLTDGCELKLFTALLRISITEEVSEKQTDKRLLLPVLLLVLLASTAFFIIKGITEKKPFYKAPDPHSIKINRRQSLGQAFRLLDESHLTLEGRYRARKEFFEAKADGLSDSLGLICENQINRLNAELDSLCQYYKTAGEVARKQKANGKASEYYRFITQIIPDPEDERYQAAQEVLVKLQEKRGNN